MGHAHGNGTEAARLSGYKGSSKVLAVQSVRLLSKANVQLSIAARRTILESQAIADAKERREVLTVILRAATGAPVDRTRAIAELNKMDGLYIEKHEHKFEIPAAIAFLITKAPDADCRD